MLIFSHNPSLFCALCALRDMYIESPLHSMCAEGLGVLAPWRALVMRLDLGCSGGYEWQIPATSFHLWHVGQPGFAKGSQTPIGLHEYLPSVLVLEYNGWTQQPAGMGPVHGARYEIPFLHGTFHQQQSTRLGCGGVQQYHRSE